MPFAHPAIAEVVGRIAFCPKTTTRPYASIDFKVFDPIPNALIAYASAGVRLTRQFFLFELNFFQLRYALDEYSTGVRMKAKFDEVTYAKRYRKYLRHVTAMEASRSQGHLLASIKDSMLDLVR